MKVGVLISLNGAHSLKEFEKVRALGLQSCQLNCWNRSLFTDEMAEGVVAAARASGVTISSFWCGWEGPSYFNFIDGPGSLGLVPEAYRFERLNMLKEGSDFCRKLGVKNIITHVGFIPEDPNDPKYYGVMLALRSLATHVNGNDQYFLFETGQETPVTLRRIIEDVGTGNLGVNLDVGNLILYGKANPVDALDVLGPYVRDVHAKDGMYPTAGRNLGQEMPLGEGKVNFPALIKRLHEIGYDGPVTIEREIDGDQQITDIKNGKAFLEGLIAALDS